MSPMKSTLSLLLFIYLQIRVKCILNTDVEAGDVIVPHHVGIFYNRTLICSGAILSEGWVVTSARCLFYTDEKAHFRQLRRKEHILVKVGDMELTERELTEQQFNVDLIFWKSLKHRWYIPDDLAVLQLSPSVNGHLIHFNSKVAPIQLARPDYRLQEFDACYLSGVDTRLHRVKRQRVDVEECEQGLLCLVAPPLSPLDVGSSVFCEKDGYYKIIGVASYNDHFEANGEKINLVVMEDITKHAQWITGHMRTQKNAKARNIYRI